MIPATTADELVAGPGRYLLGEQFIAYSPDPSLYGFSLWGPVGDATLRQAFAVLDVQLRRAPTHQAVGDLRRVQWVDTRALGLAVEFFASRAPLFAARVRRQATLLPTGPDGLLVAGFMAIHPMPYPMRVVVTPEEAAAYLEDPRVPALVAEAAALADGRAPARAAVRRLLGDGSVAPEVGPVARALGMSARTLQRRLRAEGASFQGELDAARLVRAQALMLDTDDKISSIALEVGCASLQHFSGVFRRLTGESPSQWRARHRRRPG